VFIHVHNQFCGKLDPRGANCIFIGYAYDKKGFFNCLYNIVITQNNATRISQLKEHLFNHIQIKDFGCLKYSFGIEVI